MKWEFQKVPNEASEGFSYALLEALFLSLKLVIPGKVERDSSNFEMRRRYLCHERLGVLKKD